MSEKNQYLLSAEVNRIQETLFRTSRQRQVIGGSRLLVAFSQKAKEAAEKIKDVEVVTASGGNFNILFPQRGQAEQFSIHLQTAYRLLLDGAMTVAISDEIEDPNNDHLFNKARKDVGKRLSVAKMANGASDMDEEDKGERITAVSVQTDTAHAPTTAFCVSSGIGLAKERRSIVKGDGKEYIADFALKMSQAGGELKSSQIESVQRDENDSFLSKIMTHIEGDQAWRWAIRPERISQYDSQRNNVAYLVADGNNMGKFFSKTNGKEELRTLSRSFTDIVFKALAEAIKKLLEAKGRVRGDIIPVMPLIVAGDDIFVMLPAPYALEMTQTFCRRFTELMSEDATVRAIKARPKNKELNFPTMSAAVVFCKESYPYNLAHQYGETLLGNTKKMVKKALSENKAVNFSAVSFGLLIGSELAADSGDEKTDFRAGLPAYWVESAPPTPVQSDDSKAEDDTVDSKDGWLAARETSVALSTLLDQREAMRTIPNKRRHELRELFDNLPRNRHDDLHRWEADLQTFLERISASSDTNSVMRQSVEYMLQALGSRKDVAAKAIDWVEVEDRKDIYYAHGASDLFAIWNYATRIEDHQQKGAAG